MVVEMGSSYTFFGPLICIRSKGEKNTHSHEFIIS